MKKAESKHELSRPLAVERISLGGVREKIVASPEEKKALAERFGLIDLARLEATIDVDHAEGKMFAVTGKFFADVVQECVVSLEPVPAHIAESIDVLFAPPHLLKDDGEGGGLSDLGDVDPPEPIENGVIDLGELVAQHLAMALDPYPRKEGAALGNYEIGGEEPAAEKKNNPFAKLKEMAKAKEK